MNLSQKVSQSKKDTFIKKFKLSNPEVYTWFNSAEFSSLFNSRELVYLQIEYNLYGNREVLPVLPFTDSLGTVPLDDIMEYLLTEGFDVNISIKDSCKCLAVSLKGE